jgi:hypothetical protein
MVDELTVRTHVGRDIQQTSQLFKTLEAAVWEYVANAIEYVDPGTRPEVEVDLDPRGKVISISDNGRGMDVDGLKHYFTMHAENIDRRMGKGGRGKFGTGKSAAFGIAKRLVVATVRNGYRNVVELTASDIASSDGSEIPIAWVTKDEATDSPNGTVISIGDVMLPRMNAEPLIRNIERHLAYWRSVEPIVYVGSHRCEPWQPTVVQVLEFEASPEQAKVLGNVHLKVSIAQAPLDAGLYGVAVTVGAGNLVAIESAGVESKEFGTYLFGELDVPALDAADAGLAPYDMSRSLQLNAAHPVAAAAIGFIGYGLEQARCVLVEEHAQRKSEREYRQLQKEAKKIAELLNQDLAEVAERFADLRAMRRRKGAVAEAGGTGGGHEEGEWVEGTDEPGLLDVREHESQGEAVPKGRDAPEIARPGHPDPDGTDRVSKRGGEGEKPKPRGGLSVKYENLGADADRSVYTEATKEILINLDHPMVSAALGKGGVEDVGFRRLSYEIAFTQYSVAVAQEILTRDPDMTADDALYEVRDALRRVTRRGAGLYQ